MKATLSQFRQSPRKVRLVADMIRGKTVAQARDALTFLAKKSSPEMLALLNSAVANAKAPDADALIVKMIQVNKGRVMRRFTPKARGRAGRIARTSSIITIELMDPTGAPKAKKEKEVPAADATPAETVIKKTRTTRAKKAK
jgi:large subunit ribosomal protein L22